jgi:hypothetical protein
MKDEQTKLLLTSPQRQQGKTKGVLIPAYQIDTVRRRLFHTHPAVVADTTPKCRLPSEPEA